MLENGLRWLRLVRIHRVSHDERQQRTKLEVPSQILNTHLVGIPLDATVALIGMCLLNLFKQLDGFNYDSVISDMKCYAMLFSFYLVCSS